MVARSCPCLSEVAKASVIHYQTLLVVVRFCQNCTGSRSGVVRCCLGVLVLK